MSALQQQQNNIQRLNQHATLNDARRRGRGRFAFLRAGQMNDVAAVVRYQPPLPAACIAPPPPDNVQSRQWQAYRNGRSAELNIESLWATGNPYHPLNRDHQDLDDPVFELDASPREVHQLDGQGVSQEADRLRSLSPISSLSHVTNSLEPRRAFGSIQGTLNDITTASYVQQLPPSCVKATASKESTDALGSNDSVGFDCPIRAGPNGKDLCTWPPRRDLSGFPSLARVREHVGSHGLLCPDCDKVFRIPTRYRDHRQNKVQTGVCSESGLEKSTSPKHISLPPDSILTFFVRPKKDSSDHDAWLDGYKTLHPHWEQEGSLPHPFYRNNLACNSPPPAHTIPHKDCSPGFQPSSPPYALSQAVPSALNEPSLHYDVSPIAADEFDPAFDVCDQYLNYDTTGDLHFAQALSDKTRFRDPSSGQLYTNQTFEDLTLAMSGALPDAAGLSSEESVRESADTFDFVGGEVSCAPENMYTIGAGTCAPSQSQSEDAAVSQTPIPTSAQSIDVETNPYRRAVSQQEERNDSAMEMCEAGSSSASGAEETAVHYPFKPATARSKGKQPIRHLAANTPARKNAAKRIEKLMAQAEGYFVKIQALNSENRNLKVKISEVESEKEKLLFILMKIRNEVDMWDDDDSESFELDERIDALSDRMQSIKLLLPD